MSRRAAGNPRGAGDGPGQGSGYPLLVLNAGSSTLKASLIDGDGRCLGREQTDWAPLGATRAGEGGAIEATLDAWLPGAFPSWWEPGGETPLLAAHRVVHGGERFIAPTRLSEEVLAGIASLVPLAPLHNGPALAVMRWLAERRPGVSQWACFDTAFHASLPEEACTYALPASWRRRGLRRFGFHGLNHQHVSEEVERRFRGSGTTAGADPPLRLISCHLGAGCSLCAVRGGRSIDTTMGFTPLEGLVMATRSGTVDPGLLLHLLRDGMAIEELDHALHAASGLLGLSELSGGMRDLRMAAAEGHRGARLAIAVFRHRLLQGIGAMAASLGGVDVIALSGGIGENDAALAEELQRALRWLAPFELVRIPADEEGLIARLCRRAAAADTLRG